MKRTVAPEQLDTLPHDHEVSQLIHRDIHRYNQLLGNYPWFANELRKHLRPGDSVLEIAAGRGFLMHYLVQAGVLASASRVTAFDAICHRPESLSSAIHWQLASAETFSGYHDYTVIIVNHFLHQLTDTALGLLGEQLQHARAILVSETLRHPRAVTLCQASRLIGFSRQGIGDGLLSIEAGFRKDELPAKLGINANSHDIHISETFLGAYRMRALNISSP